MFSGMSFSKSVAYSTRSQRELARSGLWAVGPVQLSLPLNAEGLSEITRASGSLQFSPDFDVLTWICERWLCPLGDDEPNYRNTNGWAFFTLRELGLALDQKEPERKRRLQLRDSLRRISTVKVDLVGYDAHTGELKEGVCTWDNLIDRVVSDLDDLRADAKIVGALRGSTFKVQLPPWLQQQLLDGRFARIHWPTLRSFSKQQSLAKRLWVYLQAEHYKRIDQELEATWIAVGDRLFSALAMDYARPRDARKALKRACATIIEKDIRFRRVDFMSTGKGRWRIEAHRFTKEKLLKDGKAHKEIREQITLSLQKD